MGFPGCKNSTESWGRRSMGFLLVFFPEDSHNPHHQPNKKPSTNPFHFLHKSQPTISIFLLLLFTFALLFILSTTLPSSSSSAAAAARRLYSAPRRRQFSSHALQGMGVLYRRGVRAMNDLVVAHATESLSQHELRLFVRLFFRSTLSARSDVVFLFPTRSSAFDDVILRENDSFMKLLDYYRERRGNESHSAAPPSFGATRFVKLSRKERESGESIWGRRTRSNFSKAGIAGSTRASYGSVVSFDADELDSENSLSGFLNHSNMGLRRWACYPMLLGRVRRNFKHVILVDIKGYLLLGDPLSRVRTHRPETVLLKPMTRRKNSDKIQPTRTKWVNPGIIMGGSRGVRRLSNQMLMAIVRASMRKKSPLFTESVLFNQLIGNDYALKDVNVIVSTELVPELGSVLKSGRPELLMKNYSIIRRGDNSKFDLDYVVMKHLCSFPEGSTVYSGC